jgi:hypothetical protein
MDLSTWDIAIGAAAGVIAVYTFIMRRHKALTLLLSAYVSYAVTIIWGNPFAELFTGERAVFSNVWIKSNAQPYMVQIGLFILVLLLLTSFVKLGGKRGRYGLLETAVYSAGAVIVSVTAALLLMPPAIREQVSSQSLLLPTIFRFADWAILVPVFLIIFFGVISSDDQV